MFLLILKSYFVRFYSYNFSDYEECTLIKIDK